MGHRADLLAAARRCLQERGYARTTARDLVAASGTNLASIGYHFGSKEALLNEAIAESFLEWAERVRALALQALPEDTADPLRTLTASWDAMLASFAEYRGLAVSFIEAQAQAERDPALREQLAAAYRRSRDQVAGMISEFLGTQGGELGLEHARALASFEIALCDGLLVQWLLDPDSTPTAGQLSAAVAALLAGQPPAGQPPVNLPAR